MLDTFSFFIYFATATAVLFAVGYLLYKAGYLKQAVIALVTVLILGGVAIASGHAEEEATVIAALYEEDIAIVEYSGELLKYNRDDLIPGDHLLLRGDDYKLVGYDYSTWYRVENRGETVAEFLYEDDAVAFTEKLDYGKVYRIETII